MLLIAVFLLSLLCFLLILRVYAQERNLRYGAKQLQERRTQQNAAPIRLAAPNAAAEALLSEVNALLKEEETERASFRRRERALREQIANISHDLRTPLTSILGYLQLVKEENLTEQQRQTYLEVVESRARVLQGLIVSFYDLSRLEAGEYPLAQERVDLREVVSELLAAFYGDLEAKFEVTVDIPEDLPCVRGDRQALSRVYTNLIRNALEHGSGTLSVTARQKPDGVETRFTNGGADWSDEALPHVFDRFYTSDQTRSGRNSGLGLAIVKALCHQMGGVARAERDGTEFTISLLWKI